MEKQITPEDIEKMSIIEVKAILFDLDNQIKMQQNFFAKIALILEKKTGEANNTIPEHNIEEPKEKPKK